MNFSRDDVKWTLGLLAAIVIGLATLGNALTDYGIPGGWLPYIRLAALIVGIVSGKLATSPLPGKDDPIKIDPSRLAVFLPFVIIGSLLAGCASLPVKQRAVVSLAASETALEAAHDAERLLCSPTSDQAKPITHCDSAQAAILGLTDAKHQQLARLFSQAFDVEVKAATALKVWRAGDPAPSTVAEYHQDASDLLALIGQVFPRAHDAVVKAQDAVDKAAAVAALIGAKS